jgi:co-chaperonin GroES (HSP10)
MKFRQETLVDRVILKPFVLGKKSAGGIVLPTNQRMDAVNSDKGTVFMVGPEAWSQFKKQPVKVGDTVFYAKYGAKVLVDPDVEDSFYILCNDVDILVGYTK